AIGGGGKGRGGMLHIIAPVHIRCGYLYSKRWSGRLRRTPECGMWYLRMLPHQGFFDGPRHFFWEVDPPAHHGSLRVCEPIHVATGGGHVGDPATVGGGGYLKEHDRDRSGQVVNGLHHWIGHSQDHVRRRGD